MSERRYTGEGLSVRVRGYERNDVRLQIEHESGAAMIVPHAVKEGESARLLTTGFDGTRYIFLIDDDKGTLSISSSVESPLLGGAQLPSAEPDSFVSCQSKPFQIEVCPSLFIACLL